MKIKILNLYAGIGGNRKLWSDQEIEVTAVENDPKITKIYKDNFPNDKIIIGDAKDFLLKHFKEYDFIWASPPCPTHSRMRLLLSGSGKLGKKSFGSSFKLPDMELYSIIIFLKHFYKGSWVVENVISYYDPLIKPYEIDNHYFWSNTPLNKTFKKPRMILNQDNDKKANRIDLKIDREIDPNPRFYRKIINNCVRPEIGLYIFNSVFKSRQEVLIV